MSGVKKPSEWSDATASDVRNRIANKKVYTAFLSQSSTSVPTAMILEDTITGLTWNRTSAGIYTLTKANAFLVNKTIPVYDSYVDEDENIYTVERTDESTMTLKTYASTDPETPVDDILTNRYFNIEIYI